MDTKDTFTLEGTSFVLPPHLIAIFEKAESQLKGFYRVSPSVNDLLRLWISCATPRAVREEFEQAVYETQTHTTESTIKAEIDDDF